MKQESNKQKTNTSVMKRVFSIVIVALIFCSSIFVLAESTNNIEPWCVNIGTPNEWSTYSVIATRGNGSNAIAMANYDNVYVVNVGVNLYAITENNNRSIWFNTGSGAYSSYSIDQFDSTYNLYYRYFVSLNNVTYLVPSYNSFDDALADISNIVNQPDGVDGYNIYVNLPAGNVAYIDIENIINWDGFTASCTMPENSSMVGPPWWNGTAKYGFASSLPSNGTSISGLSLIEWEKGNNGGVFGITSSATFSPTGPFQNVKYLVVYNPLYYGGTANGPYEWLDNPTINISVFANNVSVFPLLSSVGPGSTPGGSQVNTVIDGDVIDGEYDPETGEIIWTSNGEESTGPQTGGSNQPGAKNTINDWLQNIATQISNFFSGAIGAVTTLSNAIQNFVGILKALYIWLPSPVLGILTSAITLAITIGVIKVFI